MGDAWPMERAAGRGVGREETHDVWWTRLRVLGARQNSLSMRACLVGLRPGRIGNRGAPDDGLNGLVWPARGEETATRQYRPEYAAGSPCTVIIPFLCT